MHDTLVPVINVNSSYLDFLGDVWKIEDELYVREAWERYPLPIRLGWLEERRKLPSGVRAEPDWKRNWSLLTLYMLFGATTNSHANTY